MQTQSLPSTNTFIIFLKKNASDERNDSNLSTAFDISGNYTFLVKPALKLNQKK